MGYYYFRLENYPWTSIGFHKRLKITSIDFHKKIIFKGISLHLNTKQLALVGLMSGFVI